MTTVLPEGNGHGDIRALVLTINENVNERMDRIEGKLDDAMLRMSTKTEMTKCQQASKDTYVDKRSYNGALKATGAYGLVLGLVVAGQRVAEWLMSR